MRAKGTTIREAAEQWVGEMNAYPYDMISKLMEADYDSWHEVTEPKIGDRVFVYHKGSGEITGKKMTEDGLVYMVEFDESLLKPVYGDEFNDGQRIFSIEVPADELEIETDGSLPMWGTLWSFGDSADDYWLENMDGIRIMSECGFRVYESEDFGYFFGIDGAGYDFYESHWIPLYKARGLQWHDPMTDGGSFVMKEWRKADLYDGLLGYMTEMISDSSELVHVLKKIGFTDQEIAFEGLEVIGGEEE